MLDRNVDLSVVMTVRDKHQFKTAVSSVLAQRVKDKSYELVVVDYGSKQQDVLKELWGLKNKFQHIRSVRLLKVSGVEQYNRSIANNVGFRWSLGRHLFTLDADVVLSKCYLRLIMGKLMPNLCLRCIGKESSTMQYRKYCGCGIMIAPFDAVYAIHGYDESFVGYGEEDIDFRNRLKRSGCSVIDNGVPAWVHLSHGDAERAQAQQCSRFTGGRNPNAVRRRMNDSRNAITVNGINWGMSGSNLVKHFELK